jgi:hypothetical protein
VNDNKSTKENIKNDPKKKNTENESTKENIKNEEKKENTEIDPKKENTENESTKENTKSVPSSTVSDYFLKSKEEQEEMIKQVKILPFFFFLKKFNFIFYFLDCPNCTIT